MASRLKIVKWTNANSLSTGFWEKNSVQLQSKHVLVYDFPFRKCIWKYHLLFPSHNSTLGHVTPLGQPRSVYRVMLNTISWNPEMKWPNDLECDRHWPPLPVKRIWRCLFGANPLQVMAWTNTVDKPNLLEFWVKMAKITLKVTVNDLYFKYHPSIPGCMFGANLVIPAQICDELSYGQSKVHGQMERQTDRRWQRQKNEVRYQFAVNDTLLINMTHIFQ